MIRTLTLIFLVALPLAACDNTTRLQIESDTDWRALVERDEIGGGVTRHTVEGSGDEAIPLGARGGCWRVEKRTDAGRLRAFAGGRGLVAPVRHADARTDAPFGSVGGCHGTHRTPPRE